MHFCASLEFGFFLSYVRSSRNLPLPVFRIYHRCFGGSLFIVGILHDPSNNRTTLSWFFREDLPTPRQPAPWQLDLRDAGDSNPRDLLLGRRCPVLPRLVPKPKPNIWARCLHQTFLLPTPIIKVMASDVILTLLAFLISYFFGHFTVIKLPFWVPRRDWLN